jgi:hypothetical protein
MAVPFVDAVLPGLTERQAPRAIGRGSLVTFNYIFHKPGHDPYPMVLVTDVWPKYIRGINIHYLTFPTIKKLVFPSSNTTVCENQIFTYQYIKSNDYIVSAFRQYKRNGIQRLKKLDCALIVKALSLSRSFDPNEIEAIRKSVREQIRQLVNLPAATTDEINF